MDQGTEPIRQDIDQIRASMTNKMEQIEARIKGTVDDTTHSVKRMVDVKYQISEHPWTALGISVLVGIALGSLGDDDSPQEQRRTHNRVTGISAAAAYEQARTTSPYAGDQRTPSYDQHRSEQSFTQDGSSGNAWNQGMAHSPAGSAWNADAHQSEKPGLMDQINQQFGGEIDMLKTAAVTSLVGIVRDTIRQNMPSMHQEMERLRRDPKTSYASNTASAPYRSGAPEPATSASNYAHESYPSTPSR